MIKVAQALNSITTNDSVGLHNTLLDRLSNFFVFLGLVLIFFLLKNIYLLTKEYRKPKDQQSKEQNSKYIYRVVIFVFLLLLEYAFYWAITFTTGGV